MTDMLLQSSALPAQLHPRQQGFDGRSERGARHGSPAADLLGFHGRTCALGAFVLGQADLRPLAILPLGHAHDLRDHPRSASVSVDEVAQCGSRSVVMQLDVGASGPETSFITGAFVLDDPLARVVRMTPQSDVTVPSFFENIQFVSRELGTDRPGSEIVLLRMADVIFIQILRAYLARVPDHDGGFLGALRDPGTAAALGAMHQRAEAPWTVASLAKEAGLSRTVFAERFTQLVGEPPLGYLTRLRMQKAATLLRDGASLTEASRSTGYASEASFRHAFRQWAGVAPGAYRKRYRSSPANAE